MTKTPGDYRQMSDDIITNANVPVWDMLADAEIDLDLISVTPTREWNLISGDKRVAFGEATAENGDAAEGWDWTEYERIDGEWEFAGQDYAATDEELLRILRAVIA